MSTIQTVKTLPAMQETQVQSLGWEDPLEKEMATHSTILVWKIPWNSGVWQAIVHGNPKESAMTERLTLSFSELVYSDVLITLVHKSDCSVYIYMHTHIPFIYILFHYGLSQDMKCNPLLCSRTLLFMHPLCKACSVLGLVAPTCLTLCDHVNCSPPGSSVHGDSPGENAGVDCHALLQGIFPTQGSNPVSCIASRLFTIWATRQAHTYWYMIYIKHPKYFWRHEFAFLRVGNWGQDSWSCWRPLDVPVWPWSLHVWCVRVTC